jgi:hypothetical protein
LRLSLDRTDQIRGAIRTAQETEVVLLAAPPLPNVFLAHFNCAQAIGQAVMNDLQAQRESLLRSKNAVQETNSDLGVVLLPPVVDFVPAVPCLFASLHSDMRVQSAATNCYKASAVAPCCTRSFLGASPPF